MQDQKKVNDLEFRLTGLMPECIHSYDGAERTEEPCEEQRGFLGPVASLYGLPFIGIKKGKGDAVYDHI
jgi:hypothetical protein